MYLCDDIKVTVYCLTYNHEKYIRQALDGFVNQVTNFRYKVIVHDDASTDGTQEIIKEFALLYPEIIVPIYQEENQYSQKVGIVKKYILPKVQGEFIALCEGDDYWDDVNKLQKQVDELMKHKDCYMCVHSTREINENGTPTGLYYPSQTFNEGIVESRKFLSLNYAFHTSSYMLRRQEWEFYINNPPEFRKVCDVGDEPLMMYFGQLGNVCFINDVMSNYRRGVPGSWSSRNAQNILIGNENKHLRAMIATWKSFDEFTYGIYSAIYVPKIADGLFKLSVLEKKGKLFLKDENKEYIKFLSSYKKIFLWFSIVFPSIGRYLYIRRLKYLFTQKGY